MRNEPTCPYCGTEMELCDMDDHFPMIPEYWYRCPNCRSTSPVVQFIPDAAYDAAQRRNETPVKPLTLAEAKARNMERLPLYVECCFVGRWHGLQPLNEWVVGLGWMRSWGKPDDDPVGFLEEGYGVYWRCWTCKPTDEERRAAAWQTI